MTLVKFTFAGATPEAVSINPDRVTWVSPSLTGTKMAGTKIMFSGDEGIRVAQDYEEVLTRLRARQGTVMQGPPA
ncbi:hypothetical protein LCGC14_1749210 [marine sediment metagenome]|uniref:Uncharacterized protein n=2 Tax=root TaxID=1 RepID=A0A9C9NGZ0_9HYPH|nr:hypothetical protein [Aurantimonas coralicida]